MNREYWNVLNKEEKRHFKRYDKFKYDSLSFIGNAFMFLLKLFFYLDIFVMVFFIFIRDYSDKINVPYIEVSKLILSQFKIIYLSMGLFGLLVLSILLLNEILKIRYIKKNNIHIKFQRVNVQREKNRLEVLNNGNS